MIEKSEEKKVEIKLGNDMSSEEQNIPNLNNEIIAANNQSTNPYDLPEDFWNFVILDGTNYFFVLIWHIILFICLFNFI